MLGDQFLDRVEQDGEYDGGLLDRTAHRRGARRITQLLVFLLR
ncbi:hypothetical protein [Streptomyces sp. NPDC127033]